MSFLLYLYIHQIFINNNVFLRKIRSNNMNIYIFLYFFLTMQQDKTVILTINRINLVN